MNRTNRIVRSIGLLALFWLSMTGPARPASAAAVSTEEAVKSLIDQWIARWNAHDGGGLGELLSEDVDFVLVNGKLLKGRNEFVRVHVGQFECRYDRSVFAIDGMPVISLLRTDVALGQWRWTITGVHDADGSAAPTYHGIFTWVMVPDGTHWVIRAAQNTVDK